MRLLVTADLHYNHAASRPHAVQLIDDMNRAGGDVLLVAGDTAVADGDWLEQCLNRFDFRGPKLLVAGNHELWTHRPSSIDILRTELPARAAALGWQWIADQPFVAGDIAIVGSVGWYDFSYAVPELGIPLRFYRNKISPGAAERSMLELLSPGDDIPPAAQDVVARWNDGKFVKLHRSDEDFLAELLDDLQRHLDSLRHVKTIVAAVHHVPFAQLLPPRHGQQWDFARAFLGSERLGQLLLQYPNVRRLFCGHSHWPARAAIGPIDAVNVGSGYRQKTFWAGEV